MSRAVVRAAAIAVVGLALAVLVAVLNRESAADTVTLIGIAAGGALAVGLLGAGLLHLLKRESVVVGLMVVALTSVTAVMVGAWSAGRAMFLAEEDLHALGVVVIAAGTVGLCVALVLAELVAMASRSLGEVASRLGEAAGGDGPGERRERPPSLREFADLAARLEDTSNRLEAARAHEQALDRSRRELVSWVSHDLRTPLAGIRAISEALVDGVADDPETYARYLRMLQAESDRLSVLIEDLFELSRIHAGAVRLRLELVSLDEVVSDALAAAESLAAAKGIQLVGEPRHGEPIHLSPPEIGRVLGNLLGNAVRETPEGGRVTVTTGDDGEHAWVSVADTCGGIAREDLPRVFDTAFRGEHARTPSGHAGAGLGLAIARGLVEAHGGDIGVTNTEIGCRFLVRLPSGAAGR